MKKLDLIIPYFLGTRALFHNYIGEQNNDNVLKNSICNEQNIICAKVSLLSIILLGIKEDIVSNEGNLNYESKLIFDLLENNVEMIATNINGAYYIDGHKFDSAALAVVYIRNSMAHSKYLIDYENNNVILTNEGMNIRLNIDELSLFLINTFSMYKRNSKTNNYSIDYCNINKVETNRTIPIKRVCDLKSVIRNVEYFNFNIKSENGNVPTVCMGGLNCYVDLLKDKADKNILKKNLSDLNVVCNLYNCKLEINKEKIKDYEVENITENLEQMILNDNLPYIEQIKIIGREVQKSKNNMLNSFIPIFSNIKYLFILDGIRKTKSSDNKVIGDYLASHIGDTLSVSYDEVSALLINMFNTLFIYGLEDVYTNKLNYSLDRENEFDFSKLDLSNCNPTIDGIDYSPLYKARDTFNSVQKKYNELVNELNGKQEQLNNVKEKNNLKAVSVLENAINNRIKELNDLKPILEFETNNYVAIKDDYDKNSLYFKNRAIIVGIRNCIAHGNYSVHCGKTILESKIIFNDIYEGKRTFQMGLALNEFMNLIENNFINVLNFVIDKKNYIENVKSK